MLESGDARARRRLAAVLAVCAIASGCDRDGDGPASPDAALAARPGERTVRVALLRVAGRALHGEPGGAAGYDAAIALEGVEVCAAERRPAHAVLEPFVPVEGPSCAISDAGEPVQLEGLPANADLVITYAKDGYQPLATTFRTDEHDVAVPSWADNAAYFVPLLPQGSVEPWVEREPSLAGEGGLMAIWVIANGDYGRGEGAPTFASAADPGAAQAEGVRVTIEDEGGRLVAELETRRDRPVFVRVPAGSYAVRFAHPTAALQPVGVQEQYMIAGLPSAFDTIEVPVRSGWLAHAAFEVYCPLPLDARAFVDLPTCALEQNPGERDAGAP